MYVAVLAEVPQVCPVEETDDGYCCSIGLSRSTDGDKEVSVDVWLYPGEWDGVLIHEFAFEIAVVSFVGSDDAFTTQDRSLAYGYIPEDIRDLVIPSVCSAARSLVKHVQPPLIYRVTKNGNLPEKALYKHTLITDTLLLAGYAVADSGTDRLGRTFWLLQEVAPKGG